MLLARLSKFGFRHLVTIKPVPSLNTPNLILQSSQKAGLKTAIRCLATATDYAGKWLNANEEIKIQDKQYPVDYMTNITPDVLGMMEGKLHLAQNHPVNIVKQKVYDYFRRNHVSENGDPLFATFEDLSPITTPYQNFDNLLIPVGHKDRSEIENYFLNENTVLRCHTSAHAPDLIAMGHNNFLLSGDVYRRDTYDHLHSPIFHQLEVQRLFTKEEVFRHSPNTNLNIFDINARDSKMETEDKQNVHTIEAVKAMSSDMKKTIEEIVFGELLGHGLTYRWNNYYVQFGRPAYEMEVLYEGEWLEIVAGSILKQEIVDRAGATNKIAWSCGFGLDRIAMALYGIPDIRLMRSNNTKFTSQFASMEKDSGILFKPYSACPTFFKELILQLPRDADTAAFEYDFYELVRIAAENAVQKVELSDKFQRNHRYRITYKSWDKVMNQEEVNAHHDAIKELAASKLNAKVVY